jgi:SAM-dependent methyltransferase
VKVDEVTENAFDRVAGEYDRTWGRNPVGLLFRHVFQHRLAASFPQGARVLDLGCGTGEDALFLARRGVTVRGLDASRAMVEHAREKAAAAGLADAARFEHGRAEELAGVEPGWHGAYSNFGALNCADLVAVGRRLAQVLRAGAPVLLSFMGRHPLPAVVERALTGRGARRADGPVQVSGVPIAVRYPSPSAIRRELGPELVWHHTSALGAVVPGPNHERWVQEHPQSFGALAMVERLVRRVPGLRVMGDHVVLEGRRR